MQIVNLHRQKMLDIANTAQEKALSKALQIANLDQLPHHEPHIPEHVRNILRKTIWDTWIHTQSVYYAPIYAPAFVYTSLVQGSFMIYVFTMISVLIFPLSIFAWIQKRNGWAVAQIERLFSSAFIFVHDGRIYSNFPELNQLERQLSELETMQKTAQDTSKNISDLANKLKEKLILMGQSTDDKTLADLDNQYLLQQRLIKESEKAMQTVESKRQQCLRIRQDLFDWVELDHMKQAASQYSDHQRNELLWQQASEMELIAHDLNLHLSGIHGELGNALATWQTRHEMSR